MTASYDALLNKLKVNELKELIKAHITHVKVHVSKKKKEDLIKELKKHTKYVNNEIVLKESSAKKSKKKEVCEHEESEMSESDEE